MDIEPKEGSSGSDSASTSTGSHHSRDKRSISGGAVAKRLSAKRKAPPPRSKSDEDSTRALLSSPPQASRSTDLHSSGAWTERKRPVEREVAFVRIPQTPNPKMNSAEANALYQRTRHLIQSEYEVVEILGQTRTSVVEKVRCVRRGDSFGRYFALKEIRGRLLLSDEDKAAVLREFQIGRRFEHENLVRYYQKWEIKTAVFFLMEFCTAGSLSSFLERNSLLHQGQMNPFFWHLALDLICAVHELHASSLLHLDIKPGNILLSHRHDPSRVLTAKLGDFGNCWDVHSDEEPPEGDGSFIAPELMSGGFESTPRPTPKADIYSLGLTLFSAATSCPVTPDVWTSLKSGDRSALAPLPGDVRDLVASMLQLDLSLRPNIFELCANPTLTRAAEHFSRQLPRVELADQLNTSFNLGLEEMGLDDDPDAPERVTKKRRKSVPRQVRKDLAALFDDVS